MSIHLGRVSTYTCFVLYVLSKWDRASERVIHLDSIHLGRFVCSTFLLIGECMLLLC